MPSTGCMQERCRMRETTSGWNFRFRNYKRPECSLILSLAFFAPSEDLLKRALAASRSGRTPDSLSNPDDCRGGSHTFHAGAP